MNIIDKIMNALRDDEGLFQGGKYGRVGGRIIDALDSTVAPEQEAETAGRTLASEMGMEADRLAPAADKVTYNPFAADDPRMTKDFSMARILALDFDPSNESDVKQIQKRLKTAGYKGADGEELKVDGKFGKNSLHALRAIQSDMKKSDPLTHSSSAK